MKVLYCLLPLSLVRIVARSGHRCHHVRPSSRTVYCNTKVRCIVAGVTDARTLCSGGGHRTAGVSEGVETLREPAMMLRCGVNWSSACKEQCVLLGCSVEIVVVFVVCLTLQTLRLA